MQTVGMWPLACVIAVVGCGGGAAPPQGPLTKSFDPIIVEPAVPAEAISDDADVMVATTDDVIIKFTSERAGSRPARGTRDALEHHPAEHGRYWFSKTTTAGDDKAVFVLRRESDTRAIIVQQRDELLVPPVSWIALALRVSNVAPDDVKAWQRELGRRVATKGRATGIVLFPNGNAQAVILAEEPVEDAVNDIRLAAKIRFMKAGTFAPDAWGPKLVATDTTKVSTTNMNGHDGISLHEMLVKVPGPAAPTP